MAECPTARDVFANQGDLTPPYFVYGKENQRGVAEKDPSFGRFDIFQTWPRVADAPLSKFFVKMPGWAAIHTG